VDRSTSETLDLLVATEGLVLSTEPEAWGGCYAAGMMAAADGTSVVHEPAAHAALRLSITAGMLLGYHRRVVDRIALMRTIAATIPGGICEGQTPQEIGADTRAARTPRRIPDYLRAAETGSGEHGPECEMAQETT
jgi:hypothetical protein